MHGFEVGDNVAVTSFMGDNVKQPVLGTIVEFLPKTRPRDMSYPGNKYTHWVIVKIDTYVDQYPFSVEIGEEWPAQFDEVEKIDSPPSTNFHTEGDPSKDL